MEVKKANGKQVTCQRGRGCPRADGLEAAAIPGSESGDILDCDYRKNDAEDRVIMLFQRNRMLRSISKKPLVGSVIMENNSLRPGKHSALALR
jgi:hypothetical protein